MPKCDFTKVALLMPAFFLLKLKIEKIETKFLGAMERQMHQK